MLVFYIMTLETVSMSAEPRVTALSSDFPATGNDGAKYALIQHSSKNAAKGG